MLEISSREEKMAFTLPSLPYARDALAPTMSAETLDFHHGKHHAAYVKKANALLAEAGLQDRSLVEAIHAARDHSDEKLFNQVAQVWNHNFLWQCLAPAQGQKPAGQLAELIDDCFGSLDGFFDAFKEEGEGHFASGYTWLVLDGERLSILSLHDADTPVGHEMKPLFTIDVWEHAYYIDYRNARPDFLDKVLRTIVNWEFVASNLDGNGASRADQPGEKAMAEAH
jgi:Fe-Mn family superoxide dismutase